MLFLAESFLHDLDPVILEIFGPLAIRWYGVAYIAGFFIAWALLKWMGRTGRIAIPADRALDYIMYGVVGVLAGGRLGYVLFYDLSRSLDKGETPLLWDFSGNLPFWGVLRVWDGGMSFHGGAIGVILAIILFGLRHHLPVRHVLDVSAFITPPGLLLGRIANFINGELWGKSLPDSMRADPPWWSIKYPSEITEHWMRILHVDQLVQAGQEEPETLQALVGRLAADFNLSASSDAALREMVLAEATRRLEALEPLRSVVANGNFYDGIVAAASAGNEAVARHIQPLLTPYYPSQLIQAFAEGIVVWLALILVWLKPRRMGVVGSWFLISYGLLRILTEIFRQPDEGVALLFGLQRGQLLSVLMALIGVGCLIYSATRGPRVGGLIHPAPETINLRK